MGPGLRQDDDVAGPSIIALSRVCLPTKQFGPLTKSAAR